MQTWESGNCEGGGANYEKECQLCPDDNKSKYIEESSRNLYTRSKEHLANYGSGIQTSFISKHQGEEAVLQGDHQDQELAD